MNREELRSAAANRRNLAGAVVPQNTTWPCDFCQRSFQTENGFMRHVCHERNKMDELKSPKGAAAYSYYAEWMRAQKRSIPSADKFMNSRQYNYFISFAEWVDKTALPNPNQFIKIMIDTGTSPLLWCRSSTFSMYLQWYDKLYPPTSQFIETLDALQALAKELKTATNQIYTAIGVTELVRLIKRRKLSPWLLVVSPNFLRWLQTLGAVEQQIISDAINIGAYVMKLNEQPALAKEFRQVCEAEDI